MQIHIKLVRLHEYHSVLGEGQVYTIGNIGKHKVVSTKLARIGYEQGSKTSAGNTVTRMLGKDKSAFQIP